MPWNFSKLSEVQPQRVAGRRPPFSYGSASSAFFSLQPRLWMVKTIIFPTDVKIEDAPSVLGATTAFVFAQPPSSQFSTRWPAFPEVRGQPTPGRLTARSSPRSREGALQRLRDHGPVTLADQPRTDGAGVATPSAEETNLPRGARRPIIRGGRVDRPRLKLSIWRRSASARRSGHKSARISG